MDQNNGAMAMKDRMRRWFPCAFVDWCSLAEFLLFKTLGFVRTQVLTSVVRSKLTWFTIQDE